MTRQRASAGGGPPRLLSWSFSTHQKLRDVCPLRVKLTKVDGLPDPAGPPAERGNRIHAALEAYALAAKGEAMAGILGEPPFPREALAWRPALDARLAAYDDFVPEQEVALTTKWAESTWDEATVRGKLDLVGIVDDETVEVIDYKTGRPYSYHADQLELYALFTFLRYDWCETVAVAAWYLDDPGNVLEDVYARADDFARLERRWRLAVVEDLSRTQFPARRNPYCRNCPFSSRRGGTCVEG